jgi:hypothetical protein
MKRGAHDALGGRNQVRGADDEDDFGASFVLNRQDVDAALLDHGEDVSSTAGPAGLWERLRRRHGRLPRAVAIALLGIAVAGVAAALIGIAIVR